jgi:natural product biosynthesis luciferase-like monooxygenase protein
MSHGTELPDRPGIDFGLMFFAAAGRPDFYDFVLDVARFADERSFRFISTPERHFHRFGGPFPNPAVLSSAIAAVTRAVQVRAGSLIAPLHQVPRIVEDWALVDNVSHGRLAVAFGTGWNVDDFVLAPSAYGRQREVLHEMIEAVREAWATGHFSTTNPSGRSVSLELYPRPVQPSLPAWLTVSKSREGYLHAGSAGLNVLTHMETQDVATLATRIDEYREARDASGLDPATGIVTVMQHTLIGRDRAVLDGTADDALDSYLRAAADLERQSVQHGGAMSGGRDPRTEQGLIEDATVRDDMVQFARRRLRRGASMIGTLEECESQVATLAAIGVNEIACLVDFVEEPDEIWKSLELVDELRLRFSSSDRHRRQEEAIRRFVGEAMAVDASGP